MIPLIHTDSSWTLFLDRDGVINKRLSGYITSSKEFEFLSQVPAAIAKFNEVFGLVLVVTNQQGIGKGLMTLEDLAAVHEYMLSEIHVDKIYFAPELKSENSPNRKPKTGMAVQAKSDFPQIDFKKSVMIGDSVSDMQFGKTLGMTTIFVPSFDPVTQDFEQLVDFECASLFDASKLFRREAAQGA